MRTRLLVALAAGVLAIGSAPAGSTEARIHTLEYVGGGIKAGPVRSVLRAGDGIGAVVFRGGPERFVSVEIDDAHGLSVTGIVAQEGDEGIAICGATEKRLRVRPYENVTVYLMNGECGDEAASVATTGTVTATFTRR